jgi:hypothetical protein
MQSTRSTLAALVSSVIGTVIAVGAVPAQAVRTWACSAVLSGANALPPGVHLVAVVGGERSVASAAGEALPSLGGEPDKTVVSWSQEAQSLAGYTWVAVSGGNETPLRNAACELSIDPGTPVTPPDTPPGSSAAPAVPTGLHVEAVTPTPPSQGSKSMHFLQAAASTADAARYNFPAQNLGTPSATRRIIVGVGTRDTLTNNKTIVSVTVGGVAATIVEQFQSDNSGDGAACLAGLAIAAVPTGTTGDVIVVFSEPMLRAAISLYTVDDLASETPLATATSDAAAPTATLDVPAGGFVVGVSFVGLQATVTWKGLTRDVLNNSSLETAAWSTASDIFHTAETGRVMTATWNGLIKDPAGVWAVWPTGARVASADSGNAVAQQ